MSCDNTAVTAEACQRTSTKSPGDAAEMARLLDAGLTLREIGEIHGISHVTVRSRLLKHNCEMQPRGRQPEVNPVTLRRYLDAGMIKKDMCTTFGVSKSTLNRAIAALESEK